MEALTLAAMPSPATSDPALQGPKQGPVDALGTSEPGIDENATPVYRSAPRYPPRAQRAGIEGVVTVEFTITPEGAISDPVIIKAEPSEDFNEAVLEAITKWKFKPRIVNGRPVARRARQKISFLLDKG
jgi:protein TonB